MILKPLEPRNAKNGPTLSQFANYFEQVHPPRVDYFDYDNMNNIIKQVASSPHVLNKKAYGQSDPILNSPMVKFKKQFDS